MRVRTAVVDDEPLARDLLRRLLATRPEIELVAEHASAVEALPELRRERVDLLCLDVRMPEMDGFELLARLAPELPAVVLVTAHDEYSLRAFEVAAIDFLLKPVDDRRFHQAVDRVLGRLREQTWRRDVERLLAVVDHLRPDRFLDLIPIRSADRIVLQPVADVVWFESAGNNVVVHAARETHRIRDSLAELGRVLDPARFARISRTAIINVGRIREIRPWFHGDYLVLLENGSRVQSTRSFRDSLERFVHRRSAAATLSLA
jgi:two-component system LytT family response regulator